jgi:hypothetical protein
MSSDQRAAPGESKDRVRRSGQIATAGTGVTGTRRE